MKYKVVFNNGNPEDANLCCLCEDFCVGGNICPNAE